MKNLIGREHSINSQYLVHELDMINAIYYIKVNGIPNDNKLIKAIRYPHMWRYDILTCEDINDFTAIKFVS